MFENLAAKKIF